MSPPSSSQGIIRFGDFDVDLRSCELRKRGLRIKLQVQPFQVLQTLLEHPGAVVTRQELQTRIWPADTFVDFDQGLNNAVKKLREALGDNAQKPRFIETLSKRGYRFIGTIQNDASTAAPQEARLPATLTEATVPIAHRKGFLWALASIMAVIASLVIVLGLNTSGIRDRLLGKNLPSRIHSLAVLPLQNLSGDPAQEYFTDGMTDALITDLAQISAVRVISRTSSMQYKQTKKSLPEIARELDVDGIVEGTVQRSGNRFRITAQLVQGASDKDLWAGSYERDASELFALERDVSSDIAHQVQARLGIQKKGPTQQSRSVNAKVFEAYLQGNYRLHLQGGGSGDEEKKKAAEYFQEAIDTDPNFAPAFVGLAQAHENLLIGSNSTVRMRAAERAAEIDPAYSDARVVLGWVKWQPYLDWQGAEAEFRHAIALNPNNASAHDGLAGLLGAMGRLDEDLQESQIAQQLDPNEDHLSDALWRRRDYDGTVAIQQLMLKRHPDNGYLHEYLFETYTVKGMHKEAIQELQQALRLFGLSEGAARVQRAYTIAGHHGAIRQVAKECEDLQAAKQAFLPGMLARFYTILGEKDRALYWLQQAYDHREMIGIDGGLYCMKTDPMYDPLRSDPRFNNLLRSMGLPQ